jgi:flagellar protein FlaJ
MHKKKAKKLPVVKKQPEKEKFEFLKKLSIRLFGKISDKFSNSFISLKESLITANARVLFRTYLSIAFLFSFIIFIFSFLLTLITSIYLRLSIIFALFGLVVVPSFFAFLTFFLIFIYPFSITQSRKRDIEANLPFALTHMAAISESGAPPLTIFKILSQFSEYGEISKEAGEITRNVEVFGLDEISALRNNAEKSPSSDFKDVLEGIITTIQSGGSLKSYLIEESEKAMFEYAVRREEYNQVLSTYADIYTALLIAAPMIFIVVLAALNIMGGNLFGFTIQELMVLGTVALVALNSIFLAFLCLTQPKM